MREIEAEAIAEGPAAVDNLERLHHRFHLAGQLVMLRRTSKVSQRQLAAATGIKRGEISRIERGVGNPTQETLGRIGRALGARLTFGPSGDTVAVGPRSRSVS